LEIIGAEQRLDLRLAFVWLPVLLLVGCLFCFCLVVCFHLSLNLCGHLLLAALMWARRRSSSSAGAVAPASAALSLPFPG
jgi:hypothetical protein